MKKTNTIIGVIVVIILVGAGSFYGGMVYGKSQNSAAARMAQFRNGGGQFGPGGAGNGAVRGGKNGGFTGGEIISKDDKSITVKLPDGGSKIIFFSSSTTVGKFTDGSSGDLAVGETVSANGTANSDGSITATQIQIRPAPSAPAQGQNPTSTTNTAQ